MILWWQLIPNNMWWQLTPNSTVMATHPKWCSDGNSPQTIFFMWWQLTPNSTVMATHPKQYCNSNSPQMMLWRQLTPNNMWWQLTPNNMWWQLTPNNMWWQLTPNNMWWQLTPNNMWWQLTPNNVMATHPKQYRDGNSPQMMLWWQLTPNSTVMATPPNSTVMATHPKWYCDGYSPQTVLWWPNSIVMATHPKQYSDSNSPQTVLWWQFIPHSIVMATHPKQYCDGNSSHTVLWWQLTPNSTVMAIHPIQYCDGNSSQTVLWWPLTPNCAQIGCEQPQGKQSSRCPAASGNAVVEPEGCQWFSSPVGGTPCDHALGHWTPVGKKTTDWYRHTDYICKQQLPAPLPFISWNEGTRSQKPSSWSNMVTTGIDQSMFYVCSHRGDIWQKTRKQNKNTHTNLFFILAYPHAYELFNNRIDNNSIIQNISYTVASIKVISIFLK